MWHLARRPAGLCLLLALGATGLRAQDAAALYRTAEAAFDDHRWAEAITAYRTLAERFPTDPRAARAWHRQGEAHGALKQYAEAAAAFKTCAEKYPNEAVADSARYNEGYAHYQAQNWHAAAAAYFTYTKLGANPTQKAQAWFWRAEALYNLKRYADAIAAYQEFLSQPAELLADATVAALLPYARFSVVVCWWQDQKWQPAVDAVKVMRAKHPDTPLAADALWYGGQALRRLNQPDQAVAWLTRLVDENPKSDLAPDALTTIIEIEKDRGRTAAARAAMERLAKEYPQATAEAAGARFRLAAERLKAGDFAEAQKLYREALKGATGEARAAGLLGLAEATFGLQQWAEAARAYGDLLTAFPGDPSANRATLRRGEALLRDRQYPAAEQLYRDYLKTGPSAADAVLARYNLALALYHQNRREEAAQLFGEVARAAPKSDSGAAALLEVGRWALEKGAYHDSRQAYREFLQQHPTNEQAPAAWWGVGEASFGLEDWRGAEFAYRQLTEKFPAHELTERAWFRLVEVYRRLGDQPRAEQASATLRQKYPASALAAATLLANGRQAFDDGRYKDAVAAFQAFVDQYPDDDNAPRALANLAASLYRAEELPDNFARAAKVYAELGRKHPKVMPDAFFWAGSAAVAAGQNADAVAALQTFLKAQPGHKYAPTAQLLLGRAQVGLSQPAEAAAAFEAVLALPAAEPATRTEARHELGWLYLGQGDETKAAAAFQALVDENPTHELAADARFWLAGQQHTARQYPAAIAAYEQWLHDFPQHPLRPKALYNLAFAKEAAGQWTEAATAYDTAARAPGQEADLTQQATYRRGYCLYRAGDRAREAAEALARFRREQPDSPLAAEAAYYQGRALLALEQWPAAEPLFRELAEKYADHALAPSALYHLGVTLQNQNQYAEAAKVYQPLAAQQTLSEELRANAFLRLGETRYQLKQYQEAAEAFLRAEMSDLPALRPQARYWGGLCYQHLGERDIARDKLQKVINEAPESEWGKKAARALKELGG